MTPLFRNRAEAGRALAMKLLTYKDRPEVLCLALPRGGVPVGYQVARALGAPLDVFLVRKLGVPGHEELAMGAIASGGITVLSQDLIERFGVSEAALKQSIHHEQAELLRRDRLYRAERPAIPVQGRTVIVIDDGLATGSTMKAAVAALRKQQPAQLVIAVPVAAPETYAEFRSRGDDVVAASTPEPFYSVGQWYEDFAQTTDDEVRELLSRSDTNVPSAAPADRAAARA